AEGRMNGSGRPTVVVEDDAPGMRFRPRLWLVVVGVLAVIFVFTAYAAGRPVSTPKTENVGRCLSARVEAYVPCTEPNVGKLVAEVSPAEPCPPGSFRHQLQARNQVACLVRQ